MACNIGNTHFNTAVAYKKIQAICSLNRHAEKWN